MSRRKARTVAVQYIYSKEFGNEDSPYAFMDFVGHPKKEDDKAFAKKLIDGTIQNLDIINNLIKKYASAGDDIMSLIDKSILRVGIYELLFLREAHPVVVINEYVNIAKELSKESSKSLVNAILDKVYKGDLNE
ncbi:transcription antitermination factor NusB [Hippea maritima]|uniref:NusB antitermination factor n=1 Tax=Hippea maritima (strain ATCC 700847 / DSM 10411 / MH2) TaxID=760142 RepID=F2LY75_HIPMA|nr:transcription antitermination factor NusB [Hippea maritima]AEA34398.1 NusB antitermination factor [Hippea maritima DSM 10411]